VVGQPPAVDQVGGQVEDRLEAWIGSRHGQDMDVVGIPEDVAGPKRSGMGMELFGRAPLLMLHQRQ
jgi:hypothetical protein